MPVYQLSATYRISELELFGITVNWTLPLATSMYHVSYPLMTFRVVYYYSKSLRLAAVQGLVLLLMQY